MIRESYSEEETRKLAKEMASQAEPGDIFCLDGDLGAGKTVFAKGFAEALGITEPVTSPTFTILKTYEDGKIPLFHFDVYRITDPDEMNAIGYEDYFYGSGICLVEWSSLIDELIPQNAVRIILKRDPEKGDAYRRIDIQKK